MSRLGLSQRLVLVVAMGGALFIVGFYVTTLGNSPAQFGWFGYAPLTGTTRLLDQPDLSPWEQLLVSLGLVGLWAIGSMMLLRPVARRENSARQPE